MAWFEESPIHFRDTACIERSTYMNASEDTYAYPNGITGPAPAPAPGDDAADSRLRRIMGDDGMDRLANATVMVLGLGGVGSSCVEALVRGGVGRLVLIDRDVVSPSNVNRQIIAFQSTMGRRKIDVMREMCLDINPNVHVVTKHSFVLAETFDELYAECLEECDGRIDFVLDCIDTISTKIFIAEFAQKHGLRLISAMGAANKLQPEYLRASDLYETVNDPISRIMRKECRKRGIKHLRVVYSCEQPVPVPVREGASRSERSNLGTASYMPPMMGQMIAAETLRAIAHVGEFAD